MSCADVLLHSSCREADLATYIGIKRSHTSVILLAHVAVQPVAFPLDMHIYIYIYIYMHYQQQYYTGLTGATENAGQENDGQKCNTQNALIDH